MQTLVSPRPKRITSIDLLRGSIMIIMALDHVRDYFNADAYLFNPTDLTRTHTTLFFTRWITHFCAPIFMLLAGTSAFLTGLKKTKKELSLFLLKRGLWLILLEIVLFDFEWNFDPNYTNIYLIVIWALGVSMICLAALIHLPRKWIIVTGILLIAGHNLLDNIHVQGNNLKAFGWGLLHEQSFFQWHGRTILIGYPLLPWIGIMGLGYCLGSLYAPGFDIVKRRKILLTLGLSAIVLFILLRFSNLYGDPKPWSEQPRAWFSFLSFLNVTKYPPSLLYILMTTGPALIFLSIFENLSNAVSRVISVYGRVPMFYYIIHIFLIHIGTMAAAAIFTDFSWKVWILKEPLWFTSTLKGYGFSLGIVYLVWALIVIAVYPLCKMYDRYKTSHKEKWWLSYL